jgi:hypothetical protein
VIPEAHIRRVVQQFFLGSLPSIDPKERGRQALAAVQYDRSI